MVSPEKYPWRSQTAKTSVEKFLEWSRAQPEINSWRTIDKYRFKLRPALWYIDKEPEDITVEDINRWIVEMIEPKKIERTKPYSKEYRKHSVIILKKYVTFLGWPKNKTELVKIPKGAPKIDPAKETWLLPDEWKKYKKKAKEREKFMDYAIVLLLESSYVRLSELVNLNIDDINFEEKTVRVIEGKGGKSRFAPIRDWETEDALRTYIYRHRPEPRIESGKALFISGKRTRISGGRVEEIVKEIAIEAGITYKPRNVSPHILRHTGITNHLNECKDIRHIQRCAGHTKIETTMIYLHETHEQTIEKNKKYFREKSEQLEAKPEVGIDEDKEIEKQLLELSETLERNGIDLRTLITTIQKKEQTERRQRSGGDLIGYA